MLTLKGCRSIDAAAAQLIVRETGGHVAWPGYDPPLSAPLEDMRPLSAIVAARTQRGLDELARVPTVAEVAA
jgi:myo-inositol-1(or 4)-monophosphatase